MLVVACGSDGGTTNTPVTPTVPETITVAVSPASLGLTVGQSGTTTVTVSRGGGFAGAVALSAEGMPAGVTASFAPASVPSGSTTSTLTVDVGAAAAPGSYTLTIRGVGPGVGASTAALALTVSPRPSITLSVDASLTLARGATDTAVVRIVRTNFTGAVSLSVSGAPAGLTATLVPPSITADTALLILAAGPTAVPGTHPLTVTAQATGIETRTATLSLRVEVPFGWAQISAGDLHTCGLTTAGVAYCWGLGSAGQRGDGTVTQSALAPVRVLGNHTWTLVTVGNAYTCGLTSAGEAYCWGFQGNGRLGNGSTDLFTPQTTPVPVVGGHRWSSLSAANTHTCGVTVAGDAYCWGLSDWLGDGSAIGTNVATPRLVAGGHRWRTVSAGRLHTCGVTTSEEAYCWGFNASGHLGTGTVGVNANIPRLVVGGHRWASVNPGVTTHTCGVTTSGAGYCWGQPTYGALGIGAVQNSNPIPSPAPVTGGHSWLTITAGEAFSCGMTTTRGGFCWGRGGNGQLGIDPTPDFEIAPRSVAGGHSWSSIDSGWGYGCGITTSGRAYCWGANHFGKIGFGLSGTTHRVPVEVTTPP
jgi:alpha-tubulin suppressor-like RCC1 family protein